MKLDKLPDHWDDEIEVGAASVNEPYSGIKRDAIFDTINALLASGKARVEHEVLGKCVWVGRTEDTETGRRRLIIELK